MPKSRKSRNPGRAQTFSGDAARLGDAPPTRYRYGRTGRTRPSPTDTYSMPDGSTHTYSGTCHPDCPNLT